MRTLIATLIYGQSNESSDFPEVGFDVINITISGADTIIQTASDHGYSTGDQVIFRQTAGNTPNLDGEDRKSTR